jgi:tRNA (cmo5U34)-methyltransferase
MAVSSHLGIDVAEYDERIRTFVPYYEEMLDVCAAIVEDATAARVEPRVVELGIGSGALAARCLERRPALRLLGIDGDTSMMEMARQRFASLKASAARVELVRGDFTRTPLPRCDVVMASLALHHVASTRSKQTLYGRIAVALTAGGILVSADNALPSAPALLQRGMEAWRAHMRAHYSARQVAAYLRSWSHEDHYQPLEVELSLLDRAGLVPDIAWRRDGFAVLVGSKPRRRTRRVARSRPSHRA